MGCFTHILLYRKINKETKKQLVVAFPQCAGTRIQRKPLKARERTNKQFYSHITLSQESKLKKSS
jgi:hypothetical protein